MKDNECRVIKISKEALFEFIYEKFIEEQALYLDTKAEITTNCFMDYDTNSFMFVGYKTTDKKGNINRLPEEIDLHKLMDKMEDTTITMFSDGRYKKMTMTELLELQELGEIKNGIK